MSTEVSLVGKNLTAIPESIIRDKGETCIHLDLSENQIQLGEWLSRFKVLTTLILDHNGITSLESCPVCPTIETLWINNNEIADIKEFMDSIVKVFPNLTYLSMLRNPCTPNLYFSDGEAEAYQRFRYYVIHRMKNIQNLDSTAVDESERKESERVGHLMAPARPTERASTSPATNEAAHHVSSMKDIIANKETKTSTFLVRSKPRYDGSNSEGNRFITNDFL